MSTVVYEKNGDWSGYRIIESRTGHIMEGWCRITGNIDGRRVLVPYGGDFPRGIDFAGVWNEWTDKGSAFACHADTMPGARVLRKGEVVR